MPKPTLMLLAGDFPPGLNTFKYSTDLTPAETPDSLGLDLDVSGAIKKGTIPTGTARIQKSITITEDGADIPYLWHGGRLWNITGRTESGTSNELIFGAKNYNDVFYKPNSRFHKVLFDNDAQPILAILPVEPDTIAVVKSTGTYFVRNISDTRMFVKVSDIRQELSCTSASTCNVVNDIVFVGNSDGVMGYENGKVAEVSLSIRPAGPSVGTMAMTADYERDRLIFGTEYVFDVVAKKWFRYSGSTFRFTTRTLRNKDWSPFSVNRVLFSIEHGDTTTGKLSYKIRHEQSRWSKVYTVNLPYQSEKYVVIQDELELQYTARKWQMQITGLSSGKYIRDIMVETEGFSEDDYGE